MQLALAGVAFGQTLVAGATAFLPDGGLSYTIAEVFGTPMTLAIEVVQVHAS